MKTICLLHRIPMIIFNMYLLSRRKGEMVNMRSINLIITLALNFKMTGKRFSAPHTPPYACGHWRYHQKVRVHTYMRAKNKAINKKKYTLVRDVSNYYSTLQKRLYTHLYFFGCLVFAIT